MTRKWINFEQVGVEQIAEIAKMTGLDVADVDDALDNLEIPRVEKHGSTILIFLRNPNNNGGELYTQTLTIILNPKSILTLSTQKNAIVRELLETGTVSDKTPGIKLLIALLKKLVGAYKRSIQEVNDQVSMQKKSYDKVTSNDVLLLARSEEILNQYIAALVPMRNVLETILKKNYIKMNETNNDLFDDVFVSIKQAADVSMVNLKSIKNLREVYQIIFTNDLNRTIKLLTSLTIVLTIPTIIASLYGMNVRLPFDFHPSAFWLVAGIILFSSTTLLLIFRKRGWL